MNAIMTYSMRHVLLLTVIAWLAMLDFDFFLHAGVLAGLYLQPSPFLLPPMTAFTLIPVGYLSFLLLAVLLIWLMIRLKLVGWRQGATLGLELGGLTWGAFVLGLLSISTASFTLLIAWLIGQTLELAIAGAVVGSGLAGMGLRRLFGVVIVCVVLSVMITSTIVGSGSHPTPLIMSAAQQRVPPDRASRATRGGEAIQSPLTREGGSGSPRGG